MPYGLSSSDVTLMSSGATRALFVTGTEPGQIRVQNKNEPSTNLLALILLFCWIEKLKVYPVQCLGSLKGSFIGLQL